jgi:dihydroorotate dehydrogenase
VSFYTRAVRPALFALDAERAHELTIAALHQPFVARALGWSRDASTGSGLSQQVFGLRFSNPLGLAAGLDKQGDACRRPLDEQAQRAAFLQIAQPFRIR